MGLYLERLLVHTATSLTSCLARSGGLLVLLLLQAQRSFAWSQSFMVSGQGGSRTSEVFRFL